MAKLFFCHYLFFYYLIDIIYIHLDLIDNYYLNGKNKNYRFCPFISNFNLFVEYLSP